MRKIVIMLFAVLSLGLQTKAETFSLVPLPESVTLKPGYFSLSRLTRVKVSDGDVRKNVGLFNQFLQCNHGFQLKLVKGKGDILFEQSDRFGSEGYSLTVSEKQIVIRGGDAGIFYALQTLEQLIESRGGGLIIPGCEIVDEPRFQYRGLMLDVGRHFYSVEYVKRFIDLMSHYKLNRFHWHLTEDQGWRIEIKKYPELTRKAAWRNSSQIHRDKTQDNVPNGGFYTQEEIREIIKYASDRKITIVPEIEMPGHALAALSVYPELSCSGNIPRINEWGIFPDIYCAGNEKVFAFLEDVLTEVTDLFPGEYIHIGGDEAPKARWEKCAACQARMKAEKLKDEHELQSYFVQRIEKFLNGKGKKIIGWDEILEGGLAPNAAVMSWRGEKGGIAAAKANHHVVMTPTTYLYFDYYQAKDRSMEPYCQGGNLPLQTVYNYEPYPAELTPEECKYIMGVQANLWTEYIGNVFKADYMLYPRALALSEIAWSDSKDKDYTSFTNRLSGQLLYLDKMGVTFRIPEPLIEKEMILDNLIRVHLKTLVEGSVVLYTVDGTDPLLHGKEYHEDIMFDSTTGHSLMCVVQLPSGRNSAVYTYDINQQK